MRSRPRLERKRPRLQVVMHFGAMRHFSAGSADVPVRRHAVRREVFGPHYNLGHRIGSRFALSADEDVRAPSKKKRVRPNCITTRLQILPTPGRRFALLFCLAFVLALAASLRAPAQAIHSPLPPPTGYVNDYAHVVNDGTKQQLETILTKLDQEQQIQFAVVTVDTTNGQDIFDYSLAVARGWGVGAKDVQKPSLLLLVAIKDRNYYTQVSRHLEGDLPDGLVGEIQRGRLVPAFRAGDYSKGISDTINQYISTVAQKRGFSPDTILGSQASPEPESGFRPPLPIACCPTVIVIAIVIIVILILARRGGGRGFGGPGGGWLTWMLLSSLLSSGRRSSSGWSGGGFGGFGGSGGGGFGGFGGGGDFGGGGAGGSW